MMVLMYKKLLSDAMKSPWRKGMKFHTFKGASCMFVILQYKEFMKFRAKGFPALGLCQYQG